jgi:hypothetical protein
VEDAVGDIVKQSPDRAMHMRRLTAAMAVGARQRGPAIEARCFALLGMDGVRSESTRRGVTRVVDLPCHGHDAITGMAAAPSRQHTLQRRRGLARFEPL